MGVEQRRAAFQKKVGITVNDKNLLNLIFAVPTEQSPKSGYVRIYSNERLAFVGDAVLSTVVRSHFYTNDDGNMTTGQLTERSSALTSNISLWSIGIMLGIADLLKLDANTKALITNGYSKTISDTVEALIGTLFLDQGYDAAEAFIHRHIIAHEDILLNVWKRHTKNAM